MAIILTFEPSHQIMALFVLRKLSSSNTHAQPSSGARYLIVGQTLCLLPYFMCANSEGSGETAQTRRLTWAFAGRLCDKYMYYLMRWLIYFFFMVKNVNIDRNYKRAFDMLYIC